MGIRIALGQSAFGRVEMEPDSTVGVVRTGTLVHVLLIYK